VVQGDLLVPASYERCLDRVDVVLHLAAATGKTSSADHFAVNAEGTRLLLEQCRRHGVRRFLYVSSIAAKFQDVRHYPYARSKRQGEAAVAASGLAFTVVRPTPVIGLGSGVWEGFRKLATGTVTPIFGHGRTPIQPIYVEDLADILLDLAREPDCRNETLEIGGPEVVSIEDFIRRVGRAYNRQPRVVHVPARPVKTALAWMEPWLRPLLPLTAGQICSFVEDGTITPNRISRHWQSRLKTVEQMIALAAGRQETCAHEPAGSGGSSLHALPDRPGADRLRHREVPGLSRLADSAPS
jgi:NADH dehydrogenase